MQPSGALPNIYVIERGNYFISKRLPRLVTLVHEKRVVFLKCFEKYSHASFT